MQLHRLIAIIASVTIALQAQFAAAQQTYQMQDAVGAIDFDFPDISDTPFEPTESWIDPLITKQFRFEGNTANAVLISIRVKPDLPADDSLLTYIQAKNNLMMKAASKEHFIKRRFQTDLGDVIELIILNNRYDETFPIGISVDQNATTLQAVGISQVLVRAGRLIELAIYISKQGGEDRDAMITRARATCDAWRNSLTAHPAEPWEPTLIDPPEGYTWWLCQPTHTALLKPDGWHTKTEVQQGALRYYISKENIDEQGEYTTGFMVKVMPMVDQRLGKPATEIQSLLITQLMKDKQVLAGPSRFEAGPLIMYHVILMNEDVGNGDFIAFNLVVANNKTGTLYMIVFEAPADQWDQAWKIGQPIIENLTFASNI